MADAIDISRGTCAKIRQTLFWGFIYNVVGMPLAAFGLLSPVIAGAAMAFRSVSVAVADLERRMAAMADMRDSLKQLADCCQGDQRPDCPMLEALSGHKVAAP